EAEAIKPDHLYIQMTKAQALFALGRKAESDALYEQLERRSPDNVMISMTRGVQYMAYEHDFAKATVYLRQALERWDKNSQGLPRYMLVYLLAVSEMASDQYPAARGHFEELLRDPVYYGPAYEQLASIYRSEKNYAKALEAYSAYLTIHPEARESAEVQQQYRLYYLLDQWDKDGENVAVLNDLGQILQQKHKYADAEAYWVLALELAPDNPVVLYNLGSLYLTIQKPAQARELLEKAVLLKPDYVKAWYNLGLARQQTGDSTGAKAAWQKVLALDPTHAGAQKALAGQP
ncbi:MAG: tetratricopeptide repeat protein, partial [Candidatus Sericytochromatia bacterium]